MRTSIIPTILCTSVLSTGQYLLAQPPVPQQGAQTIITGMPTEASPNVNKSRYMITVYYTKPDGTRTSTIIAVPFNNTLPAIPVTAGLPNPTAAQVAAASLGKQMAIVASINAANIPIMPVTVNGKTYNTITAVANPATVQGMYATGQTVPKIVNGRVILEAVLAPAAFSTYTVNGVTQKVVNPVTGELGNGVYRTTGNTVTGEIGNGKGTFTPGTTPSPGSSMGRATFGGLGATTGLSTGLDGSGNPSVVGFGFLDETSSTPIDYIAAFDPPSGLDDQQILTDLSDLFNADFSTDGYTSSYDPTTDTLAINQSLPSVDFTWSADSDTGLYLEDSFNAVPEPGTLFLLGTGLAGVAACIRGKISPR